MSRTEPAAEPPPHSRLEDEVREILHRADRPPTASERFERAVWRTRGDLRRATARRRQTTSPPSLGAGAFLIGAFACALLAATVRGASPLLALLLGVASFVLLVMLWVPRVGGGGDAPKRWRGRDLDPPPSTPPWVDDLRDRFRGPPRR